jgi:hypothetical protein
MGFHNIAPEKTRKRLSFLSTFHPGGATRGRLTPLSLAQAIFFQSVVVE